MRENVFAGSVITAVPPSGSTWYTGETDPRVEYFTVMRRPDHVTDGRAERHCQLEVVWTFWHPFRTAPLPPHVRDLAAAASGRQRAGMESVKELLGHASITTTIDTYGHLTVEDARTTLEAAGWFTGREVRP